jgi:hypothetical protein
LRQNLELAKGASLAAALHGGGGGGCREAVKPLVVLAKLATGPGRGLRSPGRPGLCSEGLEALEVVGVVVFGVPVMPGLTGRVGERWMATRKDLATKLCTEEIWMSVVPSRRREGIERRKKKGRTSLSSGGAVLRRFRPLKKWQPPAESNGTERLLLQELLSELHKILKAIICNEHTQCFQNRFSVISASL